MSSLCPTAEEEKVVRRKAVVLRAKDERSNQGTLLMHVDEQNGRLVPGASILAVPVYPGQAGLEAAVSGSTMGFTCTQTIHFGPVMLSMSPILLEEVAAALLEFVEDVQMQGDETAMHAD